MLKGQGRAIFTVELQLHHWSWQVEWPMQNHTSTTEAGYEGQVHDMMNGWSHVIKTAKVNSYFFFCSFTPMSTLAGEIWMDQLSTPATFVSVSPNFQRLCLFGPLFGRRIMMVFYLTTAGQHFAFFGKSMTCKCCRAVLAEPIYIKVFDKTDSYYFSKEKLT